MKIVILNEKSPTIQLEFDPEEIEHSLFETANTEVSKSSKIDVLSKKIQSKPVLVKDSGEKEGKGELIKEEPIPSTIILTTPLIKGETPTQTLGRFVDEVREKYCGDVESEEGKKGKDYSKIPRFQLGVMPTIDTYEKSEENLLR